MKKEHILQLLAKLGAKQVQESTEWVRCSCLFAPWTHSKGTDSRPSFGISIGKQSHYHCFSCQRSGTLPILVSALCMLKGEDLLDARQFVADNEDLSIGQYEDLEKDTEPLAVLSEAILNKFSLAHPGLHFVQQRGLRMETLVEWDLRYDPAEGRLVLPVRDARGRLVGFRGRDTTGTASAKYREYKELSAKKQSLKAHGIWYGMHRLPAKGQKVILVEGELDALSLSQDLKNRPGVWAAMGASLSDEQIKTIQGLGNPVLLFFDNDKAGQEAKGKLYTKLKKIKTGIFVVDNYLGHKDPDELVQAGVLREALRSIRQVG